MITKYSFLFWTSWLITALLGVLTLFLYISLTTTMGYNPVDPIDNQNHVFNLKQAVVATDIVGTGTKNQLLKNSATTIDEKFYIAEGYDESKIILISTEDLRDIRSQKILINHASSRINTDDINTISDLGSDEIQSEQRLEVYHHITDLNLHSKWRISAISTVIMAFISIFISAGLPKNF